MSLIEAGSALTKEGSNDARLAEIMSLVIHEAGAKTNGPPEIIDSTE